MHRARKWSVMQSIDKTLTSYVNRAVRTYRGTICVAVILRGCWSNCQGVATGGIAVILMNFESFATLTVIAGFCTFFFHNLWKFRAENRGDHLSKLIVAWLGARIGPLLLGYWGPAVPNSNVYLVPAILGSFAATYICTVSLEMLASLTTGKGKAESTRTAEERTRIA
jgi:hypothetical protein